MNVTLFKTNRTKTLHLECVVDIVTNKQNGNNINDLNSYDKDDLYALLNLIYLIFQDKNNPLYGHLLIESCQDILKAIALKIKANSSYDADETTNKLQMGNKAAFEYLSEIRRKLEKKALSADKTYSGYTKWLFMQFLTWSLLILYALGCTLSIFGGLMNKIGSLIQPQLDSSPWLGSLFGSFALISFATFVRSLRCFINKPANILRGSFYMIYLGLLKNNISLENISRNG